MKKILVAFGLLIGSATGAFATCAGPSVMHDFPGSAFNMSLATNAGDGNCSPNVTIVGTLPAYTSIPAFKIDQTTPGTTNLVALAANQSVNNAQINGVTPLMGNGATGTGSQRVTIASDNTAFSVNAVQSGAWNIGTVTTLPALPANQSVNNAQINGVTPLMGNGVTGTGSQRVTVASDNTAFAVTSSSATAPVSTMNSASAASGMTAANAMVFDDVSPTSITENNFGYQRMSANRNAYTTIRDSAGNERGVTVNANNALNISIDQTTVGTTNGVSPVANPTGGSSTTGNIAANNTTAVVVKASAGTLYSIQMYGIGSAPAYLKIYNATSATCGSGTPVKRLMIPAASTAANGGGSNIDFGAAGVKFGTGITYCVTTGIGDADTTAPAASTFLVNLDWQ